MFKRNGNVTGSVLLSEVDGSGTASAKPKAERKSPSKAPAKQETTAPASQPKADTAAKQEVTKSGEDKSGI